MIPLLLCLGGLSVIILLCAAYMADIPIPPKAVHKTDRKVKLGDYEIQTETSMAYLVSCKDWDYKNEWIAKAEMNNEEGTMSEWLYIRILEAKIYNQRK